MKKNFKSDPSKLACETLETRNMLSSVQIFAAGVEGTEDIQLSISGEAVQTWKAGTGADTGDFSTFTYDTTDTVTAGQVRVSFLNDVFDPVLGIDSNLRVDAIEIDGVRYETEDPSVFSTGTWNDADGIVAGFGRGEYLNGNGFFQFADPTGETYEVKVLAAGAMGTETVGLEIGGVEVARYDLAQLGGSVGDLDARNFIELSFTSHTPVDVSDVKVSLIDSEYDPSQGIDENVAIDRIEIDGVVFETEADNVFSTGTWVDNGATPGFKNSEVLHVNGYFQYGIEPTNEAPVANDDAFSTNESSAVTFNVLANDTDADAGDVILLEQVSQGANGSTTFSGDGEVTYTPNAGFVGTDQLTYIIGDLAGEKATATVTVTVSNVNEAPVANDDAAFVNENSSVTINVLGNDTDADAGDTILLENVSQPGNGNAVISDGQVIYTPNAGFVGTDTFTYGIGDLAGAKATATVTVTVNNVNEAPVANDDVASVDENGSVSISVLNNDTDGDAGDTIVLENVSDAANGTVAIVNDHVVYTPDDHFVGTDTFTYGIGDQDGAKATATVTVTVNNVNDAPVANNDSATTQKNKAVTIDVLNNDSDKDGDNLTIVDVSSANKGHVRVSNGKIVYTPNSGFVGHDNFTYTVTDGKQSFATATVAVSVTAPPVISNGNIVTLTNKHFHANLTDIWGKAKTSLYTGSKTQWKLIASGNDTYKLKNVKSGRYLDGDSHGVDTTYHSTSHGTDWKFQQDSSGAYFLFNADYHKYLDANGKYTSVAWDPGHTEADDLWIVKSVH